MEPTPLQNAVNVSSLLFNFNFTQPSWNATPSPHLPGGVNTTPTSTWNGSFQLSASFTHLMIIVLCLIIVMALMFNTLLILMIILVKKLHSVANILIINLAVGDLILLLTVALDVDYFVKGHFAYNVTVCELNNTIFFLSLPASAVNLCLLTGERYITLQYPFARDTIFTKRRIAAVLTATWAYTIVTATLPIMGWRPSKTIVMHGSCQFYFNPNFNIFMLVCNFFIPLLIILALNVKIFSIANENMKRMPRLNTGRKKSINAIGANVKAAKRILLLVGLFLLCWLTFILTVVVNLLCGVCVPREISWAVNALNYSSSAINPILYGLLNRQIRNRSWDLVKRTLQSCGLISLSRNTKTFRGRNGAPLLARGCQSFQSKTNETNL